MTSIPTAPLRWCPTCQVWLSAEAFACPTCGALTVPATDPADRPFAPQPTPTPPPMPAYPGSPPQQPPYGQQQPPYGQQQPPYGQQQPPYGQPGAPQPGYLQPGYPAQSFPAPYVPPQGYPSAAGPSGARGKGLVVGIVVAVLIAVGVVAAVAAGGGGSSGFVGRCVLLADQGGGKTRIAKAVDCSESNDGKITSSVDKESDCPTGTDETFRSGDKLLCFDEDQG